MWRRESGCLEMFLAYYDEFEENVLNKRTYRDFLLEVLNAHDRSVKSMFTTEAASESRQQALPSPGYDLRGEVSPLAVVAMEAEVDEVEADLQHQLWMASTLHVPCKNENELQVGIKTEAAISERIPGAADGLVLRPELEVRLASLCAEGRDCGFEECVENQDISPLQSVINSTGLLSDTLEANTFEDEDDHGYTEGASHNSQPSVNTEVGEDESNSSKKNQINVKRAEERARDLDTREPDDGPNRHAIVCNENDRFVSHLHNKSISSLKRRETGDTSSCSFVACEMCDKRFTSAADLEVHVQIHTSKRPHASKFWKKDLHNVDDSQQNSQLRPYNCPVCKKDFLKVCDLQAHNCIRTFENRFVCKVCNQTFAQAAILEMHERIHSSRRPHACKFCKKAFALLHSLRKHERSHHGYCSYACNICKKRFALANDLRTHQHTHSNERQFFCKVCNRGFMRMTNLRTHERSHSGYCPYICKYCKKAFTQSGNLRRHERIHTGERPFICDYCSKSFSDSSTLVRHERQHAQKR